MKNFKFLFASLLLAISAIAFTADSAKAQTTAYIQWTGGTNADFVIGTTASTALTTDNNWSALLGSPSITCNTANIKICLVEVTYPTGSQPDKTTVVLPEIKAKYDALVSAGQLSLFVNNYTWTGASGTQYRLKTKS